MLRQTPKGVMFANGMQSGIVPIGPALPIMVEGRKVNGVGAAPKAEQEASAPIHKQNPI
jgi:hypothetical protein